MTLKELLGVDVFAGLTARVLEQPEHRGIVLGPSSTSPALALTVLTTIAPDAPYYSEVVAWASRLMQATPVATWDAELGEGSGGPSLALALQLGRGEHPPTGPSDLETSIYNHFDWSVNGDSSWQPGGATFFTLTRLLSPPTREAVAVRITAALGDRTEQIPAAVFATYGVFLTQENAFRKHAKFPYIVERLIEHGDWGAVALIDDMGERHPEAFQPDQGEKEMDYLRGKVEQNLAENSEAPQAEVVRLARLLGIEVSEF